jgi:mannose/fructose-specific phosphotransferase system component IIA
MCVGEKKGQLEEPLLKLMEALIVSNVLGGSPYKYNVKVAMSKRHIELYG